MRAMVLNRPGTPLVPTVRPDPTPGPYEIGVDVSACGVCRTDLHVVDGELPDIRTPIVPGHEIVGRIARVGAGVTDFRLGQRVGIPWLGATCGHCRYCTSGHENLCDSPAFTGYTRDGGYATQVVADSRYVVPLDGPQSDVALAPLLCAGLIGWRSLIKAGGGRIIGLYGFGAAAHIVIQIALFQGRTVFAFTRPGDKAAQDLARELGAAWVGGSDASPPEPLDAAIIYAPVGGLVPTALRAVRKGGRVVCAGIHMSAIPGFPYADLWGEREIVSVANLTRRDAQDFFRITALANVRTETAVYPLDRANDALSDLREGRIRGAAVIAI